MDWGDYTTFAGETFEATPALAPGVAPPMPRDADPIADEWDASTASIRETLDIARRGGLYRTLVAVTDAMQGFTRPTVMESRDIVRAVLLDTLALQADRDELLRIVEGLPPEVAPPGRRECRRLRYRLRRSSGRR